MALENPAAVLYNEGGIELAMTSSVAIPVSQSGIIAGGVRADGTMDFLRTSADRSLFITGSVVTSLPSTQIVTASLAAGSVVTASQGTAGTIGQSWYIRITDGTQVLGTGSSAPVYTREAGAPTSTFTQVARSATSVTILASNTNRRGAIVYNDANSNLFLRYGTSAATTSQFTVRLTSQGYHEVPAFYTGEIRGIWANAGSGNANVTEVT